MFCKKRLFRPCFLFRHLRESTIAFLIPFSDRTWIALLVVSILITILLRITFNDSNGQNEGNYMVYSVFVVFAALCQQGKCVFWFQQITKKNVTRI